MWRRKNDVHKQITSDVAHLLKDSKESLVTEALSNDRKKELKVVEEIHNEFDSAADQLLKEAQKILAEVDVPDDESAQKLAVLGFTSVPVVIQERNRKHTLEENKARVEVMEKYKKLYPYNNFITLGQVNEICRKYNLVCGTIDRYRGSIPKKNIDEMVAFKARPEDTYNIRFWRQTARAYTDDVFSNADTHPITETFGLEYHLTRVKWYICAPEADMNINWNEVVDKGIIKQVAPPDPIVLHYVKDGFLIVTKWGPEANIDI